ncbi:MAG: isochorismatase hydrolase [Chloroflexi bacterium]|jgi:nicotinamidase-related amidase|nr:isochorismatase hydrolase [Chloroflexota bacterium]
MDREDRKRTWLQVFPPLPFYDLHAGHTALLVVDMQYLDAHRDYGMGRNAKEQGLEEELEQYFQAVDAIVPRIAQLIDMSRSAGVPVIHCRIASSVADGSDLSRQHHDLHIFAAPGSREADFLDELRPLPGEIVFSKTCGGVFAGTNINTVLHNLGIDTLIVTGVVTNGCVENAVRAASDLSYRTILVDDACAAQTQALHDTAVQVLRDTYCNVRPTESLLAELRALTPAAVVMA